MKQEIVLQTEALCKNYGVLPAVRSVNLTVGKGDIYGLIGRNGAGKSTLMRLICGFEIPTSGTYSLFGTQFTDNKNIYAARRRTCSIIDNPSLYLNMSAKDNILQQCILRSADVRSSVGLLREVGLELTGKSAVSTFSVGMRKRLAIAMALVGDPELMLLDEPFTGLDPTGIEYFRTLLLRIADERGVTVLISGHNLQDLQRIANRFGIMNYGRLINEITAEDLAKFVLPITELTVSDLGKAVLVLRGKGYDAVIADDRIVINGTVDIAIIGALFVQNGIAIYNVGVRAYDLERYFADTVAADSSVFGGGI